MSELRNFKNASYEYLAEVAKGLSSPTRLEILDLLTQSERNVESIAGEIDESVANTSHHLQALKKARLVRSRRDGNHVVYQVAGDDVCDLFTVLQTTAHRRVEELRELAEDFFAGRDELEPLELDELFARVRDEDAILIDVRGRDEFDSGHVPGALSIPLDELEERLSELPRTRSIIAYCRGPYCALSARAASLLRNEGYDARRLEASVSQVRNHWEEVYATREANAVSWYRPHLDQSLVFVDATELGSDARIVDIGGGASTWPDDLMARGFDNLAVLDIAAGALERSKERLGARAEKVDWIVGDAREPHFEDGSVDLWHDRAVLHFLTDESDRAAYRKHLRGAVKSGAYVILATFAPDGPEKCSGLEVRQYSAQDMLEFLGDDFTLVASARDRHETPWESHQIFTYGLFERA